MKLPKAIVALLATLLVGGLFAGCSPKEEAKVEQGQSVGSKTNEETKTPETVEQTPPQPAGLPLSQVPEPVKTAGYEYYGLGFEKAIEYEVDSSTLGNDLTGASTTTLTAVDNGVAKFETNRTGALSNMGAEVIEARPDGIYNTKIGGQDVSPAQLVMPADIAVGKSWRGKGSMKLQDGRSFSQDMTYKAVGNEKVKTKAGEFDALKITANGNLALDGQKSQTDVSAWYVKGIGTVKMVIHTKGKDSGSMTIEATKVP